MDTDTGMGRDSGTVPAGAKRTDREGGPGARAPRGADAGMEGRNNGAAVFVEVG